MESPGSQSSSVSDTTPKRWTNREVKRAAELWNDGKTPEEIAAILGRGRQSIKHVVRNNRDLFPRRNQSHSMGGSGRRTQIKFSITPYMFNLLKKEASDRKVSMSVVINEALRDKLLTNGRVKRDR